MNDQPNLGALAAALAKAQAAFPVIVRDKEVDSRSYKFKYAPLDKIIEAVRPALSQNGLAFAQLLDGDDLVTVLLHEAGATLEGRMPLPHGQGETIQQLGSAITYLRRYSLQAMLGIAAEEDDDGEAAGKAKRNRVADAAVERSGVVTGPADPSTSGLIGTAEQGKGKANFELREEATLGHLLMFRLAEGRKGWRVDAVGPLAEMIAANRAAIEGQRVTCWGTFADESFEKDGRTITYQVLKLARLKVGVLDLSEPDDPMPYDDLDKRNDHADADFDSGWLDKVEAAVPA